jgi:hypothetical protein
MVSLIFAIPMFALDADQPIKKLSDFPTETLRLSYVIDLANKGAFAKNRPWSSVCVLFDNDIIENQSKETETTITASITEQKKYPPLAPGEQLSQVPFYGWYIVFHISKAKRIQRFYISNSHNK